MKVANAEYVSTIICREAQRKDTAKYTVTVSNEHGSDSADIELIVLGPSLAVSNEKKPALARAQKPRRHSFFVPRDLDL